jgi:hypothetical protein
MTSASNFGFLSGHDPKLVQLGAFAERYFRDDPPTCLIKVRQLAELVAKLIAAHHALYAKDRDFPSKTVSHSQAALGETTRFRLFSPRMVALI